MRVVVAIIFIVAIVGKTLSPGAFGDALQHLGVPIAADVLILLLLFSIELTTAAWLLIGEQVVIAWATVAALSAIFCSVLLYGAIFRGLYHCGCFGTLFQLSLSESILLNAALFATATYALFRETKQAWRTREDARRLAADFRSFLMMWVVALIVLAVISTIQTAETTIAVVCRTPSRDLTVYDGSAVHEGFTLESQSGAPILVDHVDTSCGCTRVTFSSHAIAPRHQVIASVDLTAVHIGVMSYVARVTLRQGRKTAVIPLSVNLTTLRR